MVMHWALPLWWPCILVTLQKSSNWEKWNFYKLSTLVQKWKWISFTLVENCSTSHSKRQLITNHVRSTREDNVFIRLCQSVNRSSSPMMLWDRQNRGKDHIGRIPPSGGKDPYSPLPKKRQPDRRGLAGEYLANVYVLWHYFHERLVLNLWMDGTKVFINFSFYIFLLKKVKFVLRHRFTPWTF